MYIIHIDRLSGGTLSAEYPEQTPCPAIISVQPDEHELDPQLFAPTDPIEDDCETDMDQISEVQNHDLYDYGTRQFTEGTTHY